MIYTAIINLRHPKILNPDKEIIREAIRQNCLSAEFWVNVNKNLLPYIKENGLLREATYNEVSSGISGRVKLVWMEESKLLMVNDKLQKVIDLQKEIDGIHEGVNSDILKEKEHGNKN